MAISVQIFVQETVIKLVYTEQDRACTLELPNLMGSNGAWDAKIFRQDFLKKWHLDLESSTDSLLVSLPQSEGKTLQFTISKQGAVQIQKAIGIVSIEVNTFGDVSVNEVSALNCLKVNAAEMHILHPISSEKLEIISQRPIRNSASIQAKYIQITAPSLLNEESIYAEETLHIQSKLGLIENYGILESGKKLIIKSSDFRNHPQALLKSEEVILCATHACTNEGIFQGRLLECHAERRFLNTEHGRIQGVESCVLSTNGLLHNQGGIVSHHILECIFDNMMNTEKAFVHSNYRIKMLSSGRLQNDGEILGASEVDCVMGLGIYNYPTGVLLGGTRACFSGGGRAIYNSGKMGAKAWVDLRASGLKLEQGAQLGSKGHLKINVLDECHNLGEIASGRFLSIEAAQLLNQALTGTIVSYHDLVMHIRRNIENQGKIGAKAAATINAEERFDNQAGAVTVAGTFLSLKSRMVNNAGAANTVHSNLLEPAQKSIMTALKPTPENAAQGLIAAGLGMRLETESCSNNGTILSHGPIALNMAKRLENLLGAYIIAFGDHSIRSQSVVLNTGKIVGKGSSLLSSPYLSNLLGGTLNSKILSLEGLNFANEGHLEADRLKVKVKETFENHLSGTISAKEAIEILSGQVVNRGLIECARTISLDVQILLENQGQIKAEESLGLMCASIIRNTGSFESLGPLRVEASHILQTLSSGQMVSREKLSLIAQFAIENASLLAGQEILLSTNDPSAQAWIKNLVDARVVGDKVDIITDTLTNAGIIESQRRSISIEAHSLFDNVLSGRLSARECVLICTKKFKNAGEIHAAKSLTLDVEAIFENQGGLEAAEQIGILCASVVHNAGKISSAGHIRVEAERILQSLSFGQMVSGAQLKLVAQFAIENAGLLLGKETCLSATDPGVEAWIRNLEAAQIVGDSVILSSANMTNAGSVQSKVGTITVETKELFANVLSGTLNAADCVLIKAKAFKNAGEIHAARSLTLDVEALFENQGALEAVEQIGILCASVVHNAGKISAGANIKISAEQIFQSLSSGQIVSGAQLRLVAQFAIENAGLLLGKETCLSTTDPSVETWIRNLESAKIVGNSVVVAGTNFSNEGRVQSTAGAITVETKELFANVLSGALNAADCVLIKTKVFKNAGEIRAVRSLTLDVEAVFENQGVLGAVEQIGILCASVVHNAGKISAAGNIRVEAERILQSLSSGQMVSGAQLGLVAKFAIENAGLLSGKETLLSTTDLGVEAWIRNLESAQIVGDSIFLKSADVDNAGLIHATRDGVGIETSQSLNNHNQAAIQAESGPIRLDAQQNIYNAGKVLAKAGSINVRAQVLINNVASGLIRAQDAVDIFSGRLSNAGSIHAMKGLAADVLTLIENEGLLSAGERLGLVCASILRNTGHIEATGPICLRAAHILQSLSSAETISTQDLALIADFAIENAGLLSGLHTKLNIKTAHALIHNLSQGRIIGESSLSTESQSLKNEGRMSGGALSLKAHVLFENMASGSITASEVLTILSGRAENFGALLAKKADLSTETEWFNHGSIEVGQSLSLKATQTLWLFRAGKITAHKTLQLLSDLKIYTEADVLAFKSLAIIAPSIEHVEGQLESRQQIILKAVDWMLAGRIKAGTDLMATVRGNWNYQESGSFEAERLADLHLDRGYTFTRPMDAAGSLAFHALHSSDFHCQTDLRAAGDLILSGGKIINGLEGGVFGRFQSGGQFRANCSYFDNVHGGVFSRANLNINAEQGICNGRTVRGSKVRTKWGSAQNHAFQYSNGSYIASGGSATLASTQGGLHNEKGEIDIAGDLSIKAPAGNINNDAGSMRVGGDATLEAMHFYHQMQVENYNGGDWRYAYALTDKPLFTIAGDLKLATPVTARGGDIHVGKNLSQSRGGIIAQPVEDFELKVRRWTEKVGHRGWKHRRKVWRSEDERRLHARYDANISAGQAIQSTDPSARFVFGSAVRTQEATLQFQDLNIGNTLDPRTRPQLPQEIDLRRYYNPHSRLFRASVPVGSAPCVVAEVALSDPSALNLNLAEPTLAQGVIEAPPFFSLDAEARFAQAALGAQLQRTTLGEARTPMEVLAQLRQDTADYARLLGVATLTEAQIKSAPVPLLIYRRERVQDQWFLVGKLIRAQGLVLEDGFFAKNAEFLDEQQDRMQLSRMQVSGQVKIEECLKIMVSQLEVRQRTITDYEAAYSKRGGWQQVAVERALGQSGVLEAGHSIAIQADRFEQIGGSIQSGSGGTSIQARYGARIKALRVSGVLQGRRNFSMRPDFVAAQQRSTGPQKMEAQEGSIEMSGLCSIAQGTNTCIAQGIGIHGVQETYALPVDEQRHGIFRQVKTGGIGFSALGSVFIGQEGVHLQATQGSIDCSHTTFMGREGLFQAQGTVQVHHEIGVQRQWVKGKGLSGFQLQKYQIRTCDETVLPSRFIFSDGLRIEAKQKVHLEGVQAFVGGRFSIEAPEVLIQEALERHTRSLQTQSVGLRFFGSAMAEQAMKGDFGRAATALLREFPILSSIEALAQSRDGADCFANGVQTLYQAYKCYLDYAEASSFTEFVQKQASQPVKVRVGHSHSEQFCDQVVASWIQAQEIVLKAQNIHLSGTSGACETLSMDAEQSIEIVAAQQREGASASSQGTTLGFGGNAVPTIGFDWSHSRSEGLHYVQSHWKVAKLASLVAGGRLSLKGVSLETVQAFIAAEVLEIQTMQDQERSQEQSGSISTDAQCSFSRGHAESYWSTEVSGISASEGLLLNIRQRLDLIGATLSVGTEAEPLLAKDPRGAEIHFYEFALPPDAESGFLGLGIPRALACKQLLEHVQDPEIRALVAPEIQATLLLDECPESMLSPELISLLEALNRAEEASEQDALEAEQALEDYCLRLDVFEAFITAYFQEALASSSDGAKNRARPLEYLCEVNGAHPHSTLDAIAQLNQLNVRVWRSASEESASTATTGSSSSVIAAPRGPSGGSLEQRVPSAYRGYIRHAVASDGNCGYTAFGITRAQAYQYLNNHLNEVSNILKPVVQEALLVGVAFYQFLVEHHYIAENISLAMIQGSLGIWSDDPQVIQAFIEFDVPDSSIYANWAHPAILQALAHIQGLDLYIWQLDNDDRLIPHQQPEYAVYSVPQAFDRVDLLFVNGNHFERLEFPEGLPQEAEALYPLEPQRNPSETSLKKPSLVLVHAYESEPQHRWVNLYHTPQGHFHVLHSSPGLVIAPQIHYQDVLDRAQSSYSGFNLDLSGLMPSGTPGASKPAIIGMAGMDYRSANKVQINRATISANVTLISDSDYLKGLNRDPNAVRETIEDSHSHVRVVVPLGDWTAVPGELAGAQEKIEARHAAEAKKAALDAAKLVKQGAGSGQNRKASAKPASHVARQASEETLEDREAALDALAASIGKDRKRASEYSGGRRDQRYLAEGSALPAKKNEPGHKEGQVLLFQHKPTGTRVPAKTEVAGPVEKRGILVQGLDAFTEVLNWLVPPVQAMEMDSAALESLRVRTGTKNSAGSGSGLGFDPRAHLEVGLAEQALIGVGRGLTKFGQGCYQSGLMSAERLGWVPSGRTEAYTQAIHAESDFYVSTPVSKSVVGNMAEAITDALPYLGGGKVVFGAVLTGNVYSSLASTMGSAIFDFKGSGSEREWTPIYQTHKSALVGTTTGIDSRGRRYYQDPKTGGFSKSAWKRRDETLTQGVSGDAKIKVPLVESQSNLWFYDFWRVTVGSGPNQMSVGITPYVQIKSAFDSVLDGNQHLGARGMLAVQGGVNIMSGRFESGSCNGQIDVDVLHAQGAVDIQAQMDPKGIMSSLGAQTSAGIKEGQHAVNVRATLKRMGMPDPNPFSENFLKISECKLDVEMSIGGTETAARVGYGNLAGKSGKMKKIMQAGKRGSIKTPQFSGSFSCELEKIQELTQKSRP